MVRSTAVGAGKARVSVVHERVTDAGEAARLKASWRERLAALTDPLESAPR
ncbi:hypothetical protein [Micromonospora fluostatini]|uniref:hypothetical protein n=1 Tax=Micromonospora sp. JCM 30529 TaxID=3421643 RepID=UPI003D1638D7